MKEYTLREKCDNCGGTVKYVVDFGQKWSWCTQCTPVVKIDLSRINSRIRNADLSKIRVALENQSRTRKPT